MNNFDDEHMPKDPVFKPEAGSVKEMLLKEEVKGYYERKKLAISNLKKIYALVWGQCSEQLQAVEVKNMINDKKCQKEKKLSWAGDVKGNDEICEEESFFDSLDLVST